MAAEYDARTLLSTSSITLLDGKGSVSLMDFHPQMCPVGYTPEFRIVQAARVSFGKGLRTRNADDALLRYLLIHQHTSPVEMVGVTLRLVVPWPIAQQFLRHRTGKFNVFSFRYSEAVKVEETKSSDKVPSGTPASKMDAKLSEPSDNFYDPTKWEHGIRSGNTLNKQGSSGNLTPDKMKEIQTLMEKGNDLIRLQHALYHKMVKAGCAKEIARFYLPMAEYTTMYMQFDLSNLLKLLTLRVDEAAQLEIQVYARAIVELVRPLFPVCFRVWEERMNGVFLSGPELTAYTTGTDLATTSESEAASYKAKLQRLQSSETADIKTVEPVIIETVQSSEVVETVQSSEVAKSVQSSEVAKPVQSSEVIEQAQQKTSNSETVNLLVQKYGNYDF